jgi:predicted dehydrogenase
MPVDRVERLLVVGLGSIGRRHARVARLVRPGMTVAAWRHRRNDEPLPPDVSSAVWSLDAALAFAPQAAVVASPASHHLDAALALASAGVPLLVEKPIAAQPEGVAALIATCDQRGLVLMTGYNLRFLPSLQRFRALLGDGVIGTVLSVRAEAGQYLPGWRPDSDYRQTVSARSALGGGVLLELSHEFDYLRWIFGEAQTVSAIVARQSALEIDVEDTAHVVLGFAPSALGPRVLATVTLDFIRHDSTRSCMVIGSAGTLRWNGITGVVDCLRAGVSEWDTLCVAPVARDATYVDEWSAFLAAIEDGAAVPVTGRDGLAVLEIVDAARRSSELRAVVTR